MIVPFEKETHSHKHVEVVGNFKEDNLEEGSAQIGIIKNIEPHKAEDDSYYKLDKKMSKSYWWENR